MATEFEREILDVLTSIRHGRSLDEAGLLLQQNGKRHLRSAEQMCALFRDVPDAIGITNELSDRLTFQMKEMGYEFPATPYRMATTWTASCANAPSRVWRGAMAQAAASGPSLPRAFAQTFLQQIGGKLVSSSSQTSRLWIDSCRRRRLTFLPCNMRFLVLFDPDEARVAETIALLVHRAGRQLVLPVPGGVWPLRFSGLPGS